MPTSAAQADLAGFGRSATPADFTKSPPSTPSKKLYSYDNGTVTINYIEGAANKYNTFLPPTVASYKGGEAPPAFRYSRSPLINLTHWADQGASAAVWFDAKQVVGKPWTMEFIWDMPSKNYHGPTALAKGVAGAPGSGFFVVLENNPAGTHLISPAWNGRGILMGKWPQQTMPAASVGIGIRTDCYYTGKKWQYNNVGLACSYQSPKGGVKRPDYYPSGLSGLHSTGTVNFSAFNAPVKITISYDGKNRLTFKAVQAHGGLKANGTGVYSYKVKLPESITKLLGSKTGWVGITGGTTACQATENIKKFSFHSGT
jgi:hypothetical protein